MKDLSGKPAQKGSFGDQLKDFYKTGKEEPRNEREEAINQDLAKEFEKWLAADEESSLKQPVLNRQLRAGKRKREAAEAKPAESAPSPQGILVGMDSARIYEQLSLKQKKEIAWLLREEGLV